MDKKTAEKVIAPVVISSVLILGVLGLSMKSDGGEKASEKPKPQPTAQTQQNMVEIVKNTPEEENTSEDAAPDFTMREIMTDRDISLKDYRGKIVMVDFWATWCGPCRMEVPHFIELVNENEDFEIIAISVDHKDTSVVQAYARRMKINYPVTHDDGTVSMKYGGIRSLPTSFMIDKKGNVVEVFRGFKPKKYFEESIARIRKKG